MQDEESPMTGSAGQAPIDDLVGADLRAVRADQGGGRGGSAVQFGAPHVRVSHALFGERPPKAGSTA
jgi:hypothetical protein